jgi:cytochrome P450
MTLAKLSQLSYLQAVIREGLRMFPPAADIFPCIIPTGGEIIFGKYLPAGVSLTNQLFCSNHSLLIELTIDACWHRRLAASYAENNFPNPYVFDPERWLGGNVSTDTRLRASQPFGQGHRSCLGKV